MKTTMMVIIDVVRKALTRTLFNGLSGYLMSDNSNSASPGHSHDQANAAK